MTASHQPDLWEFWEETKRELAAVPLEPELEPLPEHSTPYLQTYRVSFASLGGVRVSGYYTCPARENGHRLPGLLTFPGYGGAVVPPHQEASHGYASLALDPRGQGQSAAAYPMERGKLTHHPEDLWHCGLRGAYADVVRGLDFLEARGEVDAGRLALMGASGGGGLTLAGASIDDRPVVAVAHVPFMCRLVWAAENVPTHPFREAGDYLEQHPESREGILANYRYFDPLELVERLTCPTIVSVGMKDDVCPASTIVPTFEHIAGVKALVVYPELVHTHSPDFRRHEWNWVETYLTP
ncbi:MAG: acetylxylan esterase [Armatimonadota bacterium]|nr:MAG: acetylxylan esterase [Armatimonadota bacterium]